MDSFGQQAYQEAFQGHRTRKSRLGEVLAALLLLLSILLFLVTGAHALQFRSIIMQGKASRAVEYHTEPVPPENTLTAVEEATLSLDNKLDED